MERQRVQNTGEDIGDEINRRTGVDPDSFAGRKPASGEIPTSGTAWNDAGQLQDGGQQSDQGLRDKAGQMQEKAGQMQEKAGDLAGQAQQKADAGMQKAAGGLDHAAEALRGKSDMQNGTMGTAATTAAGALEQGAQMLRSTDTEQLLDNIEAMVRQRPVESMIVAAGLGFVVSKAIR